MNVEIKMKVFLLRFYFQISLYNYGHRVFWSLSTKVSFLDQFIYREMNWSFPVRAYFQIGLYMEIEIKIEVFLLIFPFSDKFIYGYFEIILDWSNSESIFR